MRLRGEICGSYLHEAAEAEHSVVHTRLLEILLCAALDVHQRHLLVPVAVEDGEKYIPRDTHGLATQRNLISVIIAYGMEEAIRTCAHCIRATLPSQSIFSMGSSGLAVAQSMIALTPTRVAGRELGSSRSPCAFGLSTAGDRHSHMPLCSCHLHCGCAPVAQEVCGVHPGPDEAAHVVSLIQCTADHLPT